MTVGITITNGIEAVVIADSRTSGRMRESDSVTKLLEFSRDSYHGAIFGTGSSNELSGVRKSVEGINAQTSQDFIADIFAQYVEKSQALGLQIINTQKKEIAIKAEIFSNPKKKKEFIDRETRDVLMRVENEKRNRNWTTLTSTLYDKNSKKIRNFSFNLSGFEEAFTNHIEIGSGSDGSNKYLNDVLAGVNLDKADPITLMYFAINAYSNSTTNAGVGGVPKIVRVHSHGIDVLPRDKTIALVNLSGAYLSETKPSLRKSKIFGLIEEIMMKEKPNYDAIGAEIGISAEVLTDINIPYSSWQEKANNAFFKYK